MLRRGSEKIEFIYSVRHLKKLIDLWKELRNLEINS